MPWVDLIDYYINLQRGVYKRQYYFLLEEEKTLLDYKRAYLNNKIHETTDKRKFKKKIKKALILTLLQILRDVSK